MKSLSMSPKEKAAIQAYMQSLSVKDRTRLYTKQFLHAAEELGLQLGAYSASRAIFNPKQIMHPEAAEASAAEVAPQKLLEKKSDFTFIEVDGVWKLAEETSAAPAQVAREITVIENPAHSVVQYEQLKAALKAEEFTSIIKVTKHGIERLIGRGFTSEEVQTLIKLPDIMKIQSDGAKVFIKQISENKYNLMIYNAEKEALVTALKNINKKDLINLGKNYGWEIE